MRFVGDLLHAPLALLFILSTFYNITITATTNNSTCPHDPFHKLHLHANIKPSEPVCCLNPLNIELTAEFLSFEEWKSKQQELQAQAQVQAGNQTPSPDIQTSDAPAGLLPTAIGDSDINSIQLEPVPLYSPHFRVPLTDRFNYASDDCSARIHTSHDTARSPAAILSSKKDRYMLSPCSARPNFVVVELCDDIRIDTVQLANFEFFSGVFRDFKVSVAQTYTSDIQGGWIEAGTYRAKNIRRVQSFHPLVELRPFYRFIRIDFLSHYGNEFYCPISLLRVYGLTQMEEWKWEVWQSGSESSVSHRLPESEDTTKSHDSVIVYSANETSTKEEKIEKRTKTASQLSPVVTQSVPHSPNTSWISSPDINPTPTVSAPTPTTSEASFITVASSQHIVSSSVISKAPISTFPPSHAIGEPLLHPNASIDALPTPSNSGSLSLSNVSHSVLSSSSVSVQSSAAPSSPSPTSSGESIYRTIMKRLAMLEANTTLYQRYVEEQTLQIREALMRLEENVGRLEGIGKSQQQIFSKTMQDLEQKRQQMDEERWELLTKVNHLADEVVLEKRLGVAQICLLLTVFIFMALTRGSRANFLDGTMHRINTLSHRRAWSSTDWPRQRFLSRSRTPTRTNYTTMKKEDQGEDRKTSIAQHENTPALVAPVSFPTTPSKSQTPRSLTYRPTTPRRQDLARTPHEGRPSGRLRRSNSHTTPLSATLSAKRFARTAHLHEVPSSAKRPQTVDGYMYEYQHMDDSSPKTRGKVKEYSTNVLLPHESPLRATSTDDSDGESWVSTERELDSDDAKNTEQDESSQEIELNPDIDIHFRTDRTPFLMGTPPSKRRRSSGHNTSSPSPASREDPSSE